MVDWFLTKLPSWLGGGAHWAGFSWTNAALPAYTLITVLVVWTGFPFIAVSVLAGLRTIPDELHESARVDGGGPWRIFWLVTYPLLKPIFLVLLLLSIICAGAWPAPRTPTAAIWPDRVWLRARAAAARVPAWAAAWAAEWAWRRPGGRPGCPGRGRCSASR